MNMYQQYIKERENLDVVETERGFICYRIDFPNCWINDYFVKKEYRQEGHGYFLANQIFQICKDAGVKEVHCQTDDNAFGCALSTYTVEHFGFELYRKIENLNYFKMEVSEWEK